jgi:hypothetical protein
MKRRYASPLALVTLLFSALACDAAVNFYPAQEAVQTEMAVFLAATAAVSGTQTELARPTPTPVARLTPTPVSTPGPYVIEDDFSTLNPRWQGCAVCAVKGGRMLMGPYPSSDSLRGYIAICKDCGSVREYKMSVDAVFLSGASDRGFGFVLREWDGNYIALEITTWQVYGVWFFDAGDKETWYTLLKKTFVPTGSLRPGKIKNHIDVEVAASRVDKDKDLFKISFNGVPLNTIEIPRGKGHVGLGVGLHSIGIAFDNFHFESLPVFDTDEDGSGSG